VAAAAQLFAVAASAQGLWRRQHQRSDCGGGIGAVIVASALVGAVIVAAALVGAVIVAAALVVAVIVVAVSAQLLRGRGCGNGVGDCGGGISAAIAGALAQQLQRRQCWCSNYGGGSIGAAIAATVALVQ